MIEPIVILRIAVTAGLIAAAIVSGTVSYFTLTSYEDRAAANHFNSVAGYAASALGVDFREKKNATLAVAKNMALWKSNASEWPNVVLPGFYDVGIQQRDSVNLQDISFMPFVQVPQLKSFETFMYNYFASEPGVNASEAGISPSGKGVYSYYRNFTTYHDTTAETFLFHSPYRFFAPLLQCVSTGLIVDSDLAVNQHSFASSGASIDAVIACSKLYSYDVAVTECVDLQDMVPLPLATPVPYVDNFYSSFFQPIFLNRNTSQFVGLVGGGFDWVSLLSRTFSNHKKGIDIIIHNHNTTVTFQTNGTGVEFKGFGNLHDTKYNRHEREITYNSRDHTREYDTTYTIYLYPSDEFYEYFRSSFPIYAAVGCGVLLGLCAVTFLFYDYYMRKSAAANEAVLETKRRFVRFISHEIRTPLNAIHLGLEALSDELRLAIATSNVAQMQPSLRNWLELSTEMTANSDCAEEVLNDLLNYDKIEIGALYLDFSSVPIWNIIETGVVASLSHFKQKNVHFSLVNRLFQVDDIERQENHRYVVVGDAARLTQVMRTLLSNALKFTPKEGSITVFVDRQEHGIPNPTLVVPPRSVHLLDQPRAGSILISVTDSGEGLSEAELAKLSAEGVQFNANELQAGKGSGLGLYIAKGIVEQHGGKLIVTSTGSGKGTTFAVELPLFHLPRVGNIDAPVVLPEEEEEGETSLMRRAANALWSPELDKRKVFVDTVGDAVSQTSSDPTALQSEKAITMLEPVPLESEIEKPEPKYLLIVDDAPSNRKILNRIFTNKGFICMQAEDGQQAVEMFIASENKTPFCAITMDYEMPVMNGPTATALLRKLGCSVPIIGVTGNVLPDDIKYFLAQGATEVLGKPLNVNKFDEVMRAHEK